LSVTLLAEGLLFQVILVETRVPCLAVYARLSFLFLWEGLSLSAFPG